VIYGLALCAGGGGLELGLALALGDRYRAVCYVEREAYPAAVLAARMDAGQLAPAPIWDDVTSFDGGVWRGSVDCVSVGVPCQPWSKVGYGGRASDKRWIWGEIARVVREVRPRIVFLENVPAFVVRGGLRPVLADLAELGFDVAWGLLRASAVGASHRRERWFALCLADAVESRCEGELERAIARGIGDAARLHGRATVAGGVGLRSDGWERETPATGAGVFPPRPADRDAWGAVLADRPELAPAIESGVCGVADELAAGLVDRAHRLRVLGNGVAPLQAAVAFRLLCDRLGVN